MLNTVHYFVRIFALFCKSRSGRHSISSAHFIFFFLGPWDHLFKRVDLGGEVYRLHASSSGR